MGFLCKNSSASDEYKNEVVWGSWEGKKGKETKMLFSFYCVSGTAASELVLRVPPICVDNPDGKKKKKIEYPLPNKKKFAKSRKEKKKGKKNRKFKMDAKKR